VKKKRFSEEQIVAVMKQAEAGVPVAEPVVQRRGPGTEDDHTARERQYGIAKNVLSLRLQIRHGAPIS
jgi:hypothetical protein